MAFTTAEIMTELGRTITANQAKAPDRATALTVKVDGTGYGFRIEKDNCRYTGATTNSNNCQIEMTEGQLLALAAGDVNGNSLIETVVVTGDTKTLQVFASLLV